MPTERLVLREYLRVSRDSTGRERSPDQQHGDHEHDGEQHDFSLHPTPYRDVGSASRYAKKARGNFDQMVTDLTEGVFGADGLALWEGSRGSRRVSEWALLLDLLADSGKKVWIHTHGRMYDARNNRDRRTLLEEAVDAEYESGKSSLRLIRDHADRAAEGRAVGRVSYGYVREYEDGKLLGRVPDPVWAPRIQELFRRFIAGEALPKVSKDWASRGILNRKGKPFHPMQLREMLRNRTYIAERVHIPGQETRWWKARGDAVITKGQWKPIVSRKVFLKAQLILDDPSRVTTRPGGARHLLSMTAVCDPCDAPVSATVSRRGERMYRCHHRGCVSISADALDDLGTRRVLAYLSSPKVYRGFATEDDAANEELAKVESQLGEVRAELDDLAVRVAAGELTVAFAARIEPGLQGRLDRLVERQRELATPSMLWGLLKPGEDVAQQWEALEDVQVRRQIARLVLTPDMAGQMRVLPTPIRGHRVPAEDRVVFLG